LFLLVLAVAAACVLSRYVSVRDAADARTGSRLRAVPATKFSLASAPPSQTCDGITCEGRKTKKMTTWRGDRVRLNFRDQLVLSPHNLAFPPPARSPSPPPSFRPSSSFTPVLQLLALSPPSIFARRHAYLQARAGISGGFRGAGLGGFGRKTCAGGWQGPGKRVLRTTCTFASIICCKEHTTNM